VTALVAPHGADARGPALPTRARLRAVPSAPARRAHRVPRWQRWAAAIGTAQPGGGLAQLLVDERDGRNLRR
jgi:hypothetical protein